MAFRARGRTLVLCFDGTADKFDGDNTNIVKLFSLLRKDDRNEQMVYYQPGLGTYVSPGVWGGVMSAVSKAVDMAVAWYLEAHVQHGYIYLMNNYRPGDRICLFGFSRGAYTARCLAGMLHKVGLLAKDNQEQVTFAFEMYKRTDEEGVKQASGFKQTFSRTVDIEFLGVWDTVSSVGSIIPRHLPFTSSSHIVKTFRHAIALDERRSKFNVNTWQKQMAEESKPYDQARRRNTWYELARQDSATYGRGETDVLEVWFAGTHADVGGGECQDDRVHSLSNISLRWMLREIARSQCGILFDVARLRGMGIPRLLFRLTSAFESFKTADAYDVNYFGEEPSASTVRFVDEPASLVQDSDTAPLIPSPKPLWSLNQSTTVSRRWSVATSNRSAPVASTPSTTSSRLGILRRFTTTFLNAARPNVEEPNEHTFEDHYKMTCEELDEEDAVEPLHDEMMLNKWWLVLELIPMKKVWQERGKWRSTFWPNLGRARRIAPHPPPNIHHTVLLRRSQTGYIPKARIPEVYNVIE